MVWALSLSLAATREIDYSFFSSGYLDVSVPRVSPHYFIYSGNDPLSLRGVPPFGYLWIVGYLRLPKAFRSLSRPSSAPGARASSVSPSSLDLFS